MKYLALLLVCVVILLATTAEAAKKKEADPRDCEVCVHNLEAIDKLIPAEKKSDKNAVEKAIGTHCTLSGFGSEWKPNPALETPKDVKMCYMFEPIKKAVSTPFAMGMPKKKVCERLKKDNPEICEVKFRKCVWLPACWFHRTTYYRFCVCYPLALKVDKNPSNVDYNKMRVKDLKTILGKIPLLFVFYILCGPMNLFH
jgi:hypothetical protein